VTFVVIDVETTGGSPGSATLTEVAAARYRAGARVGTFETLVNPGTPIPPFVATLTGITDEMVCGAPDPSDMLPSFLAFAGDAVLVGHNIEFDLGFLNAALIAAQRPAIANPAVDTLPIARLLVHSEVQNCKLVTLASDLQLDHQPSHRALSDVLATADLFHLLITRAAALGVTCLADLADLLAPPREPENELEERSVDGQRGTDLP
jgi:DNA polymerase-3 subunit epsilon